MSIADEALEEPAFTGERYTLALKGQIAYEHHHRYALCRELVRGKKVLDMASGVGWGTRILAESATHVTGIDIDEASIRFSQKRYSHLTHVEFKHGDCRRIALDDASIDVVVSFETLEHIAEHQLMMTEINRVLGPEGILVISSPNAAVYLQNNDEKNIFHKKELLEKEFEILMGNYFPHVQIYQQQMTIGSLIIPHVSTSETQLTAYMNGERAVKAGIRPLAKPVYALAICGKTPLPSQSVASIYIDPLDNLFDETQVLIQWAGQVHDERLKALAAADARYAELKMAQQDLHEHALLAAQGENAAMDETLKQSKALYETHLNAFAQVVNAHEEIITRIKADMSDLQNQRDTALRAAEQEKGRTEQLQALYQEQISQMSAVSERLDLRERAFQTAQGENATLQEALEATQALHETRMAALHANLSDMKSSNAKLQAEVETQQALFQKQNSQMNAVSARLDLRERAFQTAQGENATLQEALEATQALHETRMAALHANLSDMKSSNAKLQAEVESRSEMLAQITQFKQHLDQVQSSLEQEMSGKQALIQAHALKLWNANSERNMLKLTLRDIYTKLQKAEQRERRMKKYFFWNLIRPFEKLKN